MAADVQFSDEDTEESYAEKPGMDIIEELTEESDKSYRSSKSTTKDPRREPLLYKEVFSPQVTNANRTSEAYSIKQDLNDTEKRSGGPNIASESIFSSMSDQSDFELPSNTGDVKNKTPPSTSKTMKSEENNNSSSSKKNDPETVPEEMSVEEPALEFIMEKLIERVQDEDNEEVISLNLETDINKANTIVGYVFESSS